MTLKRLADLLSEDMRINDMTGSLAPDECYEARKIRAALKAAVRAAILNEPSSDQCRLRTRLENLVSGGGEP